ncbi:hypothetical protein M413DRAFT_443415 [Hebeloma cylindrosporum]|uniref:Uncharacterized protein n=1 Tax=Hebeloma cylindrosporum TaxID=76867 RepID=A0A0C2Y0V5_HEBCY|nr:hypothetical protein M413DRAFT_443415 [Hebeloma cylindrosporum h7]
MDLEESAIENVNKSQPPTALVCVSDPSAKGEKLDIIAEETAAKEEAFRSQIATLQVELLLQKLVTGDNVNKLEAREEKNREQLSNLKAAQEEVIALKSEVEELARKISARRTRDDGGPTGNRSAEVGSAE